MERLHAEPARAWTTTMLASTLAVSRATLSRRFPAAIGQSPGAYLTQWRMDLAAVRLRKTQDPIEVIAGAVGYQSVPAFTRAFTRSHGTTPGRYRADSRPSASVPGP
jgi:transcriptional regulator GlxA family with amidase domain